MNMLTVQYAFDLEKEGFTVLAVSPGVCCLQQCRRRVLTICSGSRPTWVRNMPIWKCLLV